MSEDRGLEIVARRFPVCDLLPGYVYIQTPEVQPVTTEDREIDIVLIELAEVRGRVVDFQPLCETPGPGSPECRVE